MAVPAGADGVAVGVGALNLVSMSAEQMTRPPPPFAEPLHWVMVAPLVVAGKGSQPVVIPSPEPDALVDGHTDG